MKLFNTKNRFYEECRALWVKQESWNFPNETIRLKIGSLRLAVMDLKGRSGEELLTVLEATNRLLSSLPELSGVGEYQKHAKKITVADIATQMMSLGTEIAKAAFDGLSPSAEHEARMSKI